jgi:L-amino acid N-acyltransferase YncA
VQPTAFVVRNAAETDVEAIRVIYNHGIEDRIATLEFDLKSLDDIQAWWLQHNGRYAVVVAVEADDVVGWASLNPFSHRCAHTEIADLSVYVDRSHRGRGVGHALLERIIETASANAFHKVVLHALDFNQAGKRLYCKAGFVEVGVFREHGRIDGRFVDVVAMELLLQQREGSQRVV